MAIFDPERGAVVVRIVYDGPPRAGKTTSVRGLGRSLLRNVETPLEAAGRTLFFDWMEYTGGLFDGHQIRCQIVSVPGQPNLAPRRRALLLGADAVVFVADTGDHDALMRSHEYITGLSRLLRAEMDPPVGVVVQANKRDLPSAVAPDELRSILGGAVAGIAITDSVASEGLGVRETFVFAVRLALDRVRELTSRGALPRGRPTVDNAEDLLASLESTGAPSTQPSDVDPAPRVSQERPVDVIHRPALPDTRVPSGAIWPPVNGRLVLHEATGSSQHARRLDSGDWVAGIGTGWRIHSARAATYYSLEEGRHALLAWARTHAALGSAISPSRCIVLAEAGDGTWRLWQIVRVTGSLRGRVDEMARSTDVQALLDVLLTVTRTLADAMTAVRSQGLVASLDTIDLGDRGPQFVGLMPVTGAVEARTDGVSPAMVVDEIEALSRSELSDRLEDIRDVLRRGWAPELTDPWARRIVARLMGREEGAA